MRRWLLFSFLTLSLADLYLTWQLFEIEGTNAAERNPVAEWILANHGWTGVSAFKAFTAFVVGLLIAAVARHRPRTAMRLLCGACVLLFGVVVYSSFLVYFPEVISFEPEGLESHLHRTNRALDAAITETRQRVRLKAQLARDLVAKRRTLADTVAGMRKLDVREAARIMQLHVVYPGCSDEQCLALNAMEFALTQHRGTAEEMKKIHDELTRAYQASYGAGVPECWETIGERVIAHLSRREAAPNWGARNFVDGAWHFQLPNPGDE